MTPLLIAPSTPRERAARIVEAATGFVYVVSRLGVTGSSSALAHQPVSERVAMLRGLTHKPLAVGFGLSRAEHLREIVPIVDGVIVGSALIDAYANGEAGEATSRVRAFVEPLVAATLRDRS